MADKSVSTESLKMEDKYSLANIDAITKVPGVAWGEWGPGDQAMSLMGLEYLKRGGEQGRSTPGTKPSGGWSAVRRRSCRPAPP